MALPCERHQEPQQRERHPAFISDAQLWSFQRTQEPGQIGTNIEKSFTLLPFHILTHTLFPGLNSVPAATDQFSCISFFSHMQSIFNLLFLPHNQKSYPPALFPAGSAFPRPLFCNAPPCLSLLGEVSTSDSIQTPSFLLQPFPSISFICTVFLFAVLLPTSMFLTAQILFPPVTEYYSLLALETLYNLPLLVGNKTTASSSTYIPDYQL